MIVSLNNLHSSFAFPTNPRNGTPWSRLKKVSSRGQAGHQHFDGLRARGDFQFDTLTAHNKVRGHVGLMPLRWSFGLAESAQGLVDTLAGSGCYIQHSGTEDRWDESGFQYVGENLYKVINMEPTGVDVVDAWYEEITDYNYGPVGNPCTKQKCASRESPPCALGHFTQVMWEETTDVGCAVAECPAQEQPTFVAVCHYGPGGNIVGKLPFSNQIASDLGFGAAACPHTNLAENPDVDSRTGQKASLRSDAYGWTAPLLSCSSLAALLACVQF